MQNLNHLELQHLRHLIGAHETVANKLSEYSQQCTDANLKQMLQCDSEDAKSNRQKLLAYLE